MNFRQFYKRFATTWSSLTAPLVEIADFEQRRRAHLLASLALFIIVFAISIGLIDWLISELRDLKYHHLTAFFTSLIAAYIYWISRRGKITRAGIAAAVGVSIGIMFTASLSDREAALIALYYFSSIVVFSSLFLSFRLALIIFFLQLVAIVAVIPLNPNVTANDVVLGPGTFHIFIAIITLVVTHNRLLLEHDRRETVIKSENRYKIISELISDYAFSARINADGKPESEWMTDSFVRVTGYTLDELDENITSSVLYHPEDARRLQEDFRRILAGESFSTEYRLITKTGDERWINMYRRPVWDEEEQCVVGYYGVVQDITEQKRADEQQLRFALERERLVLMSNFVMAVSHDFRTSLANIETSRYLMDRSLENSPEYEKIKSKLESIRSSILRLRDQLDNLSDISSVANPNPRPCDLNAMITLLCSRYQKHNDIEISLNLDTQLPVILADQSAMQRAIQHLLQNADQYSKPGGKVLISTYQQSENLCIEVHDDGPGIEGVHLPHIFDLFYRLDTARSTDMGGVGLGLSIARMVVEAHGGNIIVKSKPGAGSVFTMQLPLVPAEDVAAVIRADYAESGRS